MIHVKLVRSLSSFERPPWKVTIFYPYVVTVLHLEYGIIIPPQSHVEGITNNTNFEEDGSVHVTVLVHFKCDPRGLNASMQHTFDYVLGRQAAQKPVLVFRQLTDGVLVVFIIISSNLSRSLPVKSYKKKDMQLGGSDMGFIIPSVTELVSLTSRRLEIPIAEDTCSTCPVVVGPITRDVK